MDENVHEAITHGLRLRNVDVMTAKEDGMRNRPDPEVLDRATALGHIAVSEDEDFLAEASRRLQSGEYFAGFVRAPQGLAVGICIDGLEIIAKLAEPGEYDNKVEYLPL